MTRSFKTGRRDGRSDATVVRDLAHDAEPDTMFTYEQLMEALSVGLDEPVTTRHRVFSAVRGANAVLQEKDQRTLTNIVNVGYRVAHAHEHVVLADHRRTRAESQINRGVKLLKSARVEELTPEQQRVNEGMLMIMSGLHTYMKRHDEMLQRQSDSIKSIEERQAANLTEIRAEIREIRDRITAEQSTAKPSEAQHS